MRAVIVEPKENTAAALLQDGTVIRIKGQYCRGQVIDIRRCPDRRKRTIRTIAAAAACTALLFAGGTGVAYAAPYGTVSLDAVPSVEYTVNRFNYVIRVTGVNEEGEALVESIGKGNLVNSSIDSAVNTTVATLEESGYLAGDQPKVIMTVGTGNPERDRETGSRLCDLVQSEERCEAENYEVTREQILQAHENGRTAGRQIIETMLMQTHEGESPAPEVGPRNEIDGAPDAPGKNG